MSIRVMALVWDSDVPAAQRLTLLALADRADEDGYCWPSVATLIRKCRSSEATIRRHLKDLEGMGVLRVERRPNNSSKYWIKLDRLQWSQSDTTPQIDTTSQSETSQSETPGSQIETTGVSKRDLQGSHIETQYISDPSVDPSEIRQGARAGARQPRATRIPDDFKVSPEMVAWAQANAPHVDGRRETANFIDYWRAAAGANARKLDWVAAWRTWMRKADTRLPANVHNLPTTSSPRRVPTTTQRVNDALAFLRPGED